MYVNIEEFDDLSVLPQVFDIFRYPDERGVYSVLVQSNIIRKSVAEFPSIEQINLIRTHKHSVRGFHGSNIEKNHWKIVTCISGKVKDVILDVRRNSKTLGKIHSIELAEETHLCLLIPPGFAHAVEGLENISEILYGTNITYNDNEEFEINPIDVRWKKIWNEEPILSARDKNAESFASFMSKLNSNRE